MKGKIKKGIVRLFNIPKNKEGLQVIQSHEDHTKIGRLGQALPLTGCWPIYFLDGSKSDIVLQKEQTKGLAIEYDEPMDEALTEATEKKIVLLRESDWQYALDKKLAYTQKQVSFIVREVETSNIIDFDGSDSVPVYETIKVAFLIGPAWEKVAQELYVGSKPEDDDIDWVIERMSEKFYPPMTL